MIIDCKGKYGKFLRLGIQTNVGKVQAEAIKKARIWAHKKAKSFTFSLINTDYHGIPKQEETGYADIDVLYYTTQKEGEHLILDYPLNV